MSCFFAERVSGGEADDADDGEDAGTDDPGEERGADFLNHGTDSPGLLDGSTVFAGGAGACGSGWWRACFTLGLVGGAGACCTWR